MASDGSTGRFEEMAITSPQKERQRVPALGVRQRWTISSIKQSMRPTPPPLRGASSATSSLTAALAAAAAVTISTTAAPASAFPVLRAPVKEVPAIPADPWEISDVFAEAKRGRLQQVLWAPDSSAICATDNVDGDHIVKVRAGKHTGDKFQLEITSPMPCPMSAERLSAVLAHWPSTGHRRGKQSFITSFLHQS